MDGCLFPAILSLGLLRHKGRLFGFSSVEAAQTFGQNPERSLDNLLTFLERFSHFYLPLVVFLH